jgi:hypothetical protein
MRGVLRQRRQLPYQIALARESGDIEPHLYVSSEDPITARPESVDPELAGNHPAWIHEGAGSPPARCRLWRAPITCELQQYDLVGSVGPDRLPSSPRAVLVGQWR